MKVSPQTAPQGECHEAVTIIAPYKEKLLAHFLWQDSIFLFITSLG